MRTLRFSFDYISHNAYLAWAGLAPIAARFDLEVSPEPVLFARLLEAHDQKGPAEVAAKRRWMLRDVLRKAAALGLEINPPASHPFNPLLALRVTGVDLAPAKRTAVVSALFSATWTDGLDVSDAAVVAGILDRLGLRGEELVRAAAASKVKAALRRRTEDAVARGVFGVPTMEVDDELFFGYDNLSHLAAYLAGEDPLSGVDLSSWRTVRPSASRRPPR